MTLAQSDPCARCGGVVGLLTSVCEACGARTIQAQPGPQTQFLASSADVALYGGAAFGGKSFALLLDALQYSQTPGWSGLIFRRHAKDFADPSSIFEKAKGLYSGPGVRFRSGSTLDVRWPSGATLGFRHVDDYNTQSYQGTQHAWIGFDEAAHFEMSQILYLLSRLRSDSGTRPALRMTCNPDPDHDLAQWVEPWLRPDGCADRSKNGMTRFFARSRDNDQVVWADSRAECAARAGRDPRLVKTFSFIAALLADNVIGLASNPDYEGNLAVQGRVLEAQLLDGNWKIRAESGGMLRREWWGGDTIRITDPIAPIVMRIRTWDRAATRPSPRDDPWRGPDFSVGVLAEFDADGRGYVGDLVACRGEPPEVDELMETTAARDGASVIQAIQVDPAAAGKVDVLHSRAVLGSSGQCGPIETTRPAINKVDRVKPLSRELRLGMTGTGGVWMPRWYIRDTGWLDRPYSDPVLTTTLRELFWRQVSRFFDAREHDEIPDVLAAAVEVRDRINSSKAHAPDPAGAVRRMNRLAFGSGRR